MGGQSSTSQTQSSSLAPYSPASGALTGILGGINNLAPSAGTLTPGQTGALSTIAGNAGAASNAFGAPATAGTLGLLNGGGATANNGAITSNLGTLNSNIGATASGANIGGNSALKPQLDQIATDVGNNVNSSFAAAGRDGSPGNAQALARGVAAGQAPVIANQYNVDKTNQLNAANTLYGAGNTTFGMLNANNAQANTNFTNGLGATGQALDANNLGANGTLQAAASAFGIPASHLTTLLGAISPVAAQFGTNTGQSTGTSTMSGAQQFGMLASGLGSLLSGATGTGGLGGLSKISFGASP